MCAGLFIEKKFGYFSSRNPKLQQVESTINFDSEGLPLLETLVNLTQLSVFEEMVGTHCVRD